MRKPIRVVLLTIAAGLMAFPAASGQARAAQLLMFEQTFCEWCEVWDEEIGSFYEKTAEGKRAPLRRVNIHGKRPDDLKHIRAIVYTPTFVLVDEGKEIGRILGYPGADFFWELLDKLVEKLPEQTKPKLTSGAQTRASADVLEPDRHGKYQ